MRAVVQQMPEAWLEERVRLGIDRLDEMWEGVLHVVPPPGLLHQKLGMRLLTFLQPRLIVRRIEVLYEVGVYRPGAADRDYRVPDLTFYSSDDPTIETPRGLEGAPLAVLEIRSPSDETYEKFTFWAALGVREIIVIHPEARTAEVYRLAGERYLAVAADDQGRTHAATIDVRFSTADAGGRRLRIEHGGESCEA